MKHTTDYSIEEISLESVRSLCVLYHGYGSAGGTATYAFGVFESSVLVAAYAWQPPPPGASVSVCPEAPYAVLALSRMVSVPRAQRQLNHVSRPLRHQMRYLIDRTRWPVLVTYSDEGQGHTGHVYKCSGWQQSTKARRAFFVDDNNRRASKYANGESGSRPLSKGGYTTIQRWEHRVCPPGTADTWMTTHGWHRVPVVGKYWRSGNQAYTYVKAPE